MTWSSHVRLKCGVWLDWYLYIGTFLPPNLESQRVACMHNQRMYVVCMYALVIWGMNVARNSIPSISNLSIAMDLYPTSSTRIIITVITEPTFRVVLHASRTLIFNVLVTPLHTSRHNNTCLDVSARCNVQRMKLNLFGTGCINSRRGNNTVLL
jgi:hypothetical protein